MTGIRRVQVALVSAAVGVVSTQPQFARAQAFHASPLPGEPRAIRYPSRQDATGGPKLVSVVVKLEDDSLASFRGGVAGLAATSPAVTGAPRLDAHEQASQRYLSYLDQKQGAFEAAALAAIPAARAIHRLQVVFGGVSMIVPATEVNRLAALPGVKAVYPDELLQLQTEVSPDFIKATKVWNGLNGAATQGEGVIVAVLDTGIWPEHPSYSDPPPVGGAYPSPPAQWMGTTCQFSGGANPGASFTCNNKLIGAQRFMATYDAIVGLLPGEFTTARDDNGHGTHTSSTAAGNRGVDAQLFGIPRGEVSGIAPRAHVVMYKVCGDDGCYGSDSAAAVQQAIMDGVDVINFSIGGGANPYGDVAELAFLDAYNAGVFVAASAGNDGPGANTVEHRGPWVTTVAASTSDRFFSSGITLTANSANSLMLTGATVTEGITTTAVVNAASVGDPYCLSSTGTGAFSGRLVICRRGSNARVEKSFNVAQLGGVGMLLYNQTLEGLATDNFFIPGVHLENVAGAALLNFFNSETNVMATFDQGTATPTQGDVMAPFSSRGGPGQTLGVSKPDITAPGVQILAGDTPAGATVGSGQPGELFQAIQGTSMSSPHIAGVAALVKALHSDWTPGQIKSALMTTATSSVLKEDGIAPADPFDDGSGRVNARRATKPPATFDVAGADYLTHQNDLWNANYPSLYVPVMAGRITVTRAISDTTGSPSNWNLQVVAPPDLTVKVNPNMFTLPANGSQTLDVIVNGQNLADGQVRHAGLVLTGGQFPLHFPITVVRGQPSLQLNKVCIPEVLPLGDSTDCTITITNTAPVTATVALMDRVKGKLALQSGSVMGGSAMGDTVMFSGTLPPGTREIDIATTATAPSGYMPLSSFGISPIAGVGDDTIHNFSTAPFVYNGQTYTGLGMTSNGTIVVGGGTSADATFNNQSFPNPTVPNNVLAPFWTDLNPSAAGALRIGILTDGVDDWIVADWAGVRNYSSASELNSFEVWIGTNGVEDITFVYSTVTAGNLNKLTVGAEDAIGAAGDNFYVNTSGTSGTGTLPTSGTMLRVSTFPPPAASKHVITFTTDAVAIGPWSNCAKLTSDTIFGKNIVCASGQVTP